MCLPYIYSRGFKYTFISRRMCCHQTVCKFMSTLSTYDYSLCLQSMPTYVYSLYPTLSTFKTLNLFNKRIHQSPCVYIHDHTLIDVENYLSPHKLLCCHPRHQLSLSSQGPFINPNHQSSILDAPVIGVSGTLYRPAGRSCTSKRGGFWRTRDKLMAQNDARTVIWCI